MAKFRRKNSESSENFKSDPSAPKFKKEKPRKGAKRQSRDSRPRGGSRDSRSRGGRDSGSRGSFSGDRGPVTMHSVTCDKCRKQCEVPFLPTESKPVYCSNCFRKDGGSRSGGNDDLLKEINKKLDRILKGLDL
jgi:CxxC-x17-CxxC domain-containing protein